jgi:hypothetical protein
MVATQQKCALQLYQKYFAAQEAFSFAETPHARPHQDVRD